MLYKPMETFGFIYKITNILNGKIYVGQTTQRPAKRWTAHKCERNKPKWPIHKAIARYGAENFEFIVIEECASRSALDQAECRWIAGLRSKKPGGYNVTDGGGGAKGYRFSAEACAKRSERLRGRYVSPETGRKISASKKGWKPSPEMIAKSAESRRGQHHSEERKAKIGAAHRGKKLSAAHIEKLRQIRTGFRHTDEAKAKLCRGVVAAGIEYASLSAAAEALGVSIATVQRRVEKGMVGYRSTIEMKRRRKRTPEQIDRHRQNVSKPIFVDGTHYPSVIGAASHLGVCKDTIRRWIADGRGAYLDRAA